MIIDETDATFSAYFQNNKKLSTAFFFHKFCLHSHFFFSLRKNLDLKLDWRVKANDWFRNALFGQSRPACSTYLQNISRAVSRWRVYLTCLSTLTLMTLQLRDEAYQGMLTSSLPVVTCHTGIMFPVNCQVFEG